MQRKIKFSAVLIVVLISCNTIKTLEYLRLNENQVDSFSGSFTKDKTDSNYLKIEQNFPSLAVNDTFQEKYQIIYKTQDVEGHKAFYAIRPKDTTYHDARFGPNHFLFASLIFEKGKVFVAPAYDLKDLSRLKFSNFKFIIP